MSSEQGGHTCQVCGREFARKGRSRAVYCSAACRRRGRADRERGYYNERKAVTSQVVSRTIGELRVQASRDEYHNRPPPWVTLEARIDGLVSAHEAMLDGELGARFAFRQSLLDTASAAVLVAATLPAPTLKLQSDQRDRVSA